MADLTFIAEVKEAKANKTASLDKVYTIKLVTDDPKVMQLSVLGADELVKVEVTNTNG